MGLENTHIESIGMILEKVLKSLPLFVDYRLVKCNTQIMNSPTKITNYDFSFISEVNDRWLFIRLQDFFNYQSIIIWINQLKDKQNVNLDIKNYFMSELNNKTIKQKLILKYSSESTKDLEFQLNKIFNYIAKQSDDKLQKVILGEIWVDMPMDWGGYK